MNIATRFLPFNSKRTRYALLSDAHGILREIARHRAEYWITLNAWKAAEQLSAFRASLKATLTISTCHRVSSRDSCNKSTRRNKINGGERWEKTDAERGRRFSNYRTGRIVKAFTTASERLARDVSRTSFSTAVQGFSLERARGWSRTRGGIKKEMEDLTRTPAGSLRVKELSSKFSAHSVRHLPIRRNKWPDRQASRAFVSIVPVINVAGFSRVSVLSDFHSTLAFSRDFNPR